MAIDKLPSDVVQDILVNIPDFVTLQAAIQSCKALHDAFKTHPRSIVREVLANVVGPAFPQATRYAQYSREDRIQPDDLPSEAHYCSLDWMPDKALTSMLEENQRAIRQLEDFFSIRHKDRTSTASKLTPDESLRFHRAMYRYWLYIEALSRDAFGDQFSYHSLHEGTERFLGDLTTDEILELLSARACCEEAMRWQNSIDGGMADHRHLGIDPGKLARDLQRGVNTGPFKGWWAYARGVLHDILISRGMEQDQVDQKLLIAIVHTANGAEDTCARCSAVRGLELIGTPNVFLLSGIFPFGVKLSLLGRLLSDDEAEMKRMKTYLLRGHNGRRVPEEEIFHGLIDTVLDPSRDGRVDDEQHRWSKDEWYCLRCIKDLYRQRFMAWWRQTKEIVKL